MTVNPFYRYGSDRISLVTPFTYRDGVSLLRLIEELRAYVNENIVGAINGAYDGLVQEINDKIAEIEQGYNDNVDSIHTQFQQFVDQINALVDSINNRVGPLNIIRVNLTGNQTLQPGIDWTTEQPLTVVVSQDASGGHTLTAVDIVGTVFINPEPNSFTIFNIIHDGDNYRIFSPRSEAIDAVLTSPEVTDELDSRYSSVSTVEAITEKVGVDLARGWSVKHVNATTGVKEHYVVTLKGGDSAGRIVGRVIGGDVVSDVVPNRETLKQFNARIGAPIMVNGSGWWDSNRLMGLSIINGVLTQGWTANGGSDLGQEAAVFMKNGELIIYDNSTPAQQIVDDGGWHSFSWGHAVYKNGFVTDFLQWPRYAILSARTLIGSTNSGDLKIVVFPGVTGEWGATGGDIVQSLGGGNHDFKNLYILDGGGSTQLLVKNQYAYRSSDPSGDRAVADALYFFAPEALDDSATWQTHEGRLNGASGGTYRTLISNGHAHILLGTINVSGVTPGTLVRIVDLPAGFPKPVYTITGLSYISSDQGAGLNTRVSPTGNGGVDITIPSGVTSTSAVSFYVSYPITQEYR